MQGYDHIAIPQFIMLSGVPCVGKSTWRAQMMDELNRLDIPVTVLSEDDMALNKLIAFTIARVHIQLPQNIPTVSHTSQIAPLNAKTSCPEQLEHFAVLGN